MIRLSPHFALNEARHSQTAIDKLINNDPDQQAVIYLALFASTIAEPMRELFGGVAMRFSSWFRCMVLNLAVGGTDRSAHIDGRAGDIGAHNGFTVREMFTMIIDSDIQFDKLILERKDSKRWIHIQIAKIGRKPRRRALIATFDPKKGKMIYSTYR